MKVGFLGAGNMAAAMVDGLLHRGRLPPDGIGCAGGGGTTAPALAARTGIRLLAGPADWPSSADVLVVAVKPQRLAALDPGWGALAAGRLVLSVVAGKPLEVLAAAFPGARGLIRAMPNTPGRIGAGVTAWAAAGPLAPDDRAWVDALLGGLGRTVEVAEPQLDAVTGLSGSGPAYVFEFIAGLRAAGEAAGLDRKTACLLADETVLGAARLVAATGEDPEDLRRAVTSPGGTTAAGLAVLESAGLRPILRETVLAATRRARELASA